MLELHHAEICIYEMGFSGSLTREPNYRFECLMTCLQSIKLWIDLLLTISPSEYCGFHFGTYTMMIRCFIDLWRLQTLDYPEWDCTLVSATIDVSAVLATIESNFAQLNDVDGASPHLEFSRIMVSKLGGFRASWDALIASTSAVHFDVSTAMEDWTDFPAGLLDTVTW